MRQKHSDNFSTLLSNIKVFIWLICWIILIFWQIYRNPSNKQRSLSSRRNLNYFNRVISVNGESYKAQSTKTIKHKQSLWCYPRKINNYRNIAKNMHWIIFKCMKSWIDFIPQRIIILENICRIIVEGKLRLAVRWWWFGLIWRLMLRQWGRINICRSFDVFRDIVIGVVYILLIKG